MLNEFRVKRRRKASRTHSAASWSGANAAASSGKLFAQRCLKLCGKRGEPIRRRVDFILPVVVAIKRSLRANHDEAGLWIFSDFVQHQTELHQHRLYHVGFLID